MISEAFLASLNVLFIEEKVNCHIDWFFTHGSHYVLFISIGTTLAKEYQTSLTIALPYSELSLRAGSLCLCLRLHGMVNHGAEIHWRLG